MCPDFIGTAIPSVGLCVLTSSVLGLSHSVSWVVCPDFIGTGFPSALIEKLDKRASKAEKLADKHFKSVQRELGDKMLSNPPKGAPKWAVAAGFLTTQEW